MKASHFSSSFTTTTTLTYTNYNSQTTPTPPHQTSEIPIISPTEPPIPITVHLPNVSSAAIKIQSSYRSHRIKTLFKTISSVNSRATQIQNQIQRQETIDAIRSDEREKIKMNEALMSLLIKLDAVPGVNPTVREARRKVSRRIVGLQEILDSVSSDRVVDSEEVMRCWEEMLVEMEREAWEERGFGDGNEMERFCLETLGFRCMERFLRGV